MHIQEITIINIYIYIYVCVCVVYAHREYYKLVYQKLETPID